jgi:hypothetical protein
VAENVSGSDAVHVASGTAEPPTDWTMGAKRSLRLTLALLIAAKENGPTGSVVSG